MNYTEYTEKLYLTLLKYIVNIFGYGVINKNLCFQTDPLELTSEIIRRTGVLTSWNILNINTGKFTGRSPEDRYFVNDFISRNKIEWNKINKPFSKINYAKVKNDIINHLNINKEFTYLRHFYVRKGEKLKNFSIFTESPEHNLFAYNMFIRPSVNELYTFKTEWTIYHAPTFFANPDIHQTRQENFVIICFSEKTILIGGTAYTGEIKKAVFSTINFLYPIQNNILTMHCAANVDKNTDDCAIFFGLSGTGKTTLSADPTRLLIGDDEHGWTEDNRIFNLEGGCYAKVIHLSEEKEPDIWNALYSTALLENVVLDNDLSPNFTDSSITENTRVSYPLENLKNRYLNNTAPSPTNIFLLTCDAFGIIPPLSLLTYKQAVYHFVSGYSAKIAGTEFGIKEPVSTFSSCFGGPFMPLPISKYASMFYSRIKNSNIKVWLVNTGWIGGNYNGDGKRINLTYTRALINNVLENKIDENAHENDKYFGFKIINKCQGVPDDVLIPHNLWPDSSLYHEEAVKLVEKFNTNFQKFSNDTNILTFAEGGPIFKLSQ